MRYSGQTLSRQASLRLIADIEAWCDRTGTNYNKLVTAARVNPGIRHRIRCTEISITFETAQRLRDTMRNNPEGITREQHKARLKRRRELAARQDQAARNSMLARRVERIICPRCGSLNCERHSERQQGLR